MVTTGLLAFSRHPRQRGSEVMTMDYYRTTTAAYPITRRIVPAVVWRRLLRATATTARRTTNGFQNNGTIVINNPVVAVTGTPMRKPAAAACQHPAVNSPITATKPASSELNKQNRADAGTSSGRPNATTRTGKTSRLRGRAAWQEQDANAATPGCFKPAAVRPPAEGSAQGAGAREPTGRRCPASPSPATALSPEQKPAAKPGSKGPRNTKPCQAAIALPRQATSAPAEPKPTTHSPARQPGPSPVRTVGQDRPPASAASKHAAERYSKGSGGGNEGALTQGTT
jgi:hypothetical protein